MKQLPKSIKTYIIKNFIQSHILFYPTSLALTNWWSLGLLAGFCLVIQIITGVWLALYYSPDSDYSFITLQHIMRDVNYGWLVRYMHMNGASLCFIIVYLHMAKAFYLKSFTAKPKTWRSGIILLLLFMASAFMGYNLPWSQMGYWGAVVITSLLTSISYIGQDITTWVWGGFGVGNFTLKRFFVLHFILPFILLGAISLHLLCLHEKGSSTPLQIIYTQYVDFRLYFYLKDMLAILAFIYLAFYFIFVNPYGLNHVDSFVMANFMVTPHHIVPEWYFLPYYAMLRSFPNKLYGFSILVISILILFIISKYQNSTTQKKITILFSISDNSLFKGNFFLYNAVIALKNLSPIYSYAHYICFWYFCVNFIMLGWIGTQPVIIPYTLIGMVSTTLYFLFLTWWSDFNFSLIAQFFTIQWKLRAYPILILFYKFETTIEHLNFLLVYFVNFRAELYFGIQDFKTQSLEDFKELNIFLLTVQECIIEFFQKGLLEDLKESRVLIIEEIKRNWHYIDYYVFYSLIRLGDIQMEKNIIISYEIRMLILNKAIQFRNYLRKLYHDKKIFLLPTLIMSSPWDWFKTCIWVLEVLSFTLAILVSIAYFTLSERKILAKLQKREGPSVTGIWGVLQPLVDGIKLFLKEAIYPSKINPWLFWAMPIFSLSFSLLGWVFVSIDFTPPTCKASLALLIFFGIAALNTYTLILAAWSSNSKYSLLGCIRAVGQLLAYELILGFSLLMVGFFSGSFNIDLVVAAQSKRFFCFSLFPFAVATFIGMLMETNRTPFDLPEAESELVGGYHTEIAGPLFAFIMVAEYSNIMLMSSIWVIMFWGGWIAPCACFTIFSAKVIFIAKVSFLTLLVIICRAILPRFRFDQTIRLAWKHMLPFILAMVFLYISYAILAGSVPEAPYFSQSVIDFTTQAYDPVTAALKDKPSVTQIPTPKSSCYICDRYNNFRWSWYITEVESSSELEDLRAYRRAHRAEYIAAIKDYMSKTPISELPPLQYPWTPKELPDARLKALLDNWGRWGFE
jgi:ubiquinol-cytochrome c reductase cytochrome b subunit